MTMNTITAGPIENYDVQITPLESSESLFEDWQDLASKAPANCFLSWPWIETWLKCAARHPSLIKIKKHSTLIAIGLLCMDKKTSKAWLHQTGQQQYDQIWVEYNALVAAKEHQHEAMSTLLMHITEQKPFRTMIVSGATQKDLLSALNKHKFLTHINWEAPTFFIDLSALRKKEEKAYIATLSRNTRYQIRKVQKGKDLKLERAIDLNTAMAHFASCAQWHKQRWSKTETGSGFDNPDFVRFHETLIRNHFNSGAVHIWCLSASDHPVAYAYNLLDKNHAFFYLSAIDYQQSLLDKPGMVLHSLIIQWYLDNGYIRYDFMGGTAQYKKSLGTQGPTLVGLDIIQPSPLNRLKQGARNLKKVIQRKG